MRLDLDGRTGWGEACPYPGFADDDLQRAEGALQAAFADGRWLDAVHDGDLLALERLGAAVALRSASAACALETAALDLIAQRGGASVGEFLAWYAGTGAPKRVPFGVALGPTDDIADFDAPWEDGVRMVKVKIGRTEADLDVARVESLRARFGDALEIRLDANGAFTAGAAAASMQRFAHVRPSLCEQPVPAGTLGKLQPLPFPFAADESMANADEREWVVRTLPMDLVAVVLKPTAMGGPLQCLRIAQALSGSRVGVIVTHMFEGPVAFALACELASALPGAVLPSGLAPHGLLGHWGIELEHAGPADAGSARLPGLGVAPTRLPS